MALKGDRIELADGSRVKYFMNETATRGGIVIFDTTSGEGMDDPDAKVIKPTGTNGVAAGVLMNDVVNIDLSRYWLNRHVDEVQVGNKVALLTRGVIRTNSLKTGDTPSAGGAAYYTTNGEFTTTSGSAQVGRFISNADGDGYVEVEINIQ